MIDLEIVRVQIGLDGDRHGTRAAAAFSLALTFLSQAARKRTKPDASNALKMR